MRNSLSWHANRPQSTMNTNFTDTQRNTFILFPFVPLDCSSFYSRPSETANSCCASNCQCMCALVNQRLVPLCLYMQTQTITQLDTNKQTKQQTESTNKTNTNEHETNQLAIFCWDLCDTHCPAHQWMHSHPSTHATKHKQTNENANTMKQTPTTRKQHKQNQNTRQKNTETTTNHEVITFFALLEITVWRSVPCLCCLLWFSFVAVFLFVLVVGLVVCCVFVWLVVCVCFVGVDCANVVYVVDVLAFSLWEFICWLYKPYFCVFACCCCCCSGVCYCVVAYLWVCSLEICLIDQGNASFVVVFVCRHSATQTHTTQMKNNRKQQKTTENKENQRRKKPLYDECPAWHGVWNATIARGSRASCVCRAL